MTNHGTTPASANEFWSAYTHVTAGGKDYEIRHPKAPYGTTFTIYRWSDQVGHVRWQTFGTLEACLESLKATENAVVANSRSLVNAINL